MYKKILLIVVVAGVFIVGARLYFGGFPIGMSHGKFIVYKFSCGDLCPQNGVWVKYYFNVKTREECEAVNGKILSAPPGAFAGPSIPGDETAIKGYYACTPN
jgi:hypothetical protein